MTLEKGTKSNTEKKETLNKLYRDLYADKICFKLTSEESEDIRDSVIELVKKVADKLGQTDARFRCRDVILVGSAKEGTQIIVPNEYDFLLVLGAIEQDEIKIKRACPEKENCVHVTVKGQNLRAQFLELLEGEELRATGKSHPFARKLGLREAFHCAIKDAIREVKKEKIYKSTGILSVHHRSVNTHGPALMLSFEWHGHKGNNIEISVDLCPVIRLIGEFPELLNSENVACDEYYNYARAVGTVSLLPCKSGFSCNRGLCFSVIFTEAEMELMKDLSEHHKKCYKILKYLFNAKQRPSIGKMFDWFEDNLAIPETAFFSYMLKLLVLDHQYQQRFSETCLASCIERLLHKILNIAQLSRIVIPSLPPRMQVCNPFFRKQNIYRDHRLRFVDHSLDIKLRILLLDLEAIGTRKDYKYEDCFVESVREININLLAMPFTLNSMAILITFYVCPEASHLFENACGILIWQLIDLGRIFWRLRDPIQCRNEKCCVPLERRKELVKQNDSGIAMESIYLMGAVEMAIFTVYIYPDCAHLIGDMCSFLKRKFLDLWKQA